MRRWTMIAALAGGIAAAIAAGPVRADDEPRGVGYRFWETADCTLVINGQAVKAAA